MSQQPDLFSVPPDDRRAAPAPSVRLDIAVDVLAGVWRLTWTEEDARQPLATGELSTNEVGWFMGYNLEWNFQAGARREGRRYGNHPSSTRALVNRVRKYFAVADERVHVEVQLPVLTGTELTRERRVATFTEPAGVWPWLGGRWADFARLRLPASREMGAPPAHTAACALYLVVCGALRVSPDPAVLRRLDAGKAKATPDVEADEPDWLDPWSEEEEAEDPQACSDAATARMFERLREQNARRWEVLNRVQRNATRMRELEAQRKQAQAARRAAKASATAATAAAPVNVRPAVEVPAVGVRTETPRLPLQATAFPLSDLRAYFLREQAAAWWVANQSDELLALPYCRIERLEYQLRTALRVLGPLRGRALLSDEVGLGKTIEAGLVLKELLLRGMVRRFLVLTVPSLVDQWEEELADKFGITTVTTNHSDARDDLDHFWREHPALIASLHTLKQPAHAAVARTVKWDLLVVDEAHYLRNRDSQAWQAVNALPRQFLLLLTATPVQNSLEELYNLVTLLQPGQFPTPKEFRARYVDPKRPRQPRAPEELRRALSQVMIRNTRANAGLQLPPRRAETVLFTPDGEERAFWEGWEAELRSSLARMTPGQSSLWGRLLLQAAGSSPHAWREALAKFPEASLRERWRATAPFEASWQKRCQLVLPLTRGEGGVVFFTQFLKTQAALAEFLERAGVPTFVIHGGTPPPERQPITEAFRRQGGALLLTHSGTEGRNLQFSHRLVNLDLPWNPMEIEQRIGRLHRLGQQHPVRIYNLVQAGTLQEHLLDLLQEKLNLFELVVGETGLILGERFGSDEFAEEVLRRWQQAEGGIGPALAALGEELAAARAAYDEVRQLDETLFKHDYESL
ncbi:MAG: DEAD/DEAH box helicase [Verrucomicrobiales bacterium]|nr:DEAD/DEAH box helicase [Verrucomicrobiales bacterium]